MERVFVNLPGKEYEILIERGILDQAGKRMRTALLRRGRAAVVTDSNVGPLYADRVKKSLTDAGFTVKVLTVPAGETSKSAKMLSWLWEEFMAFG
ncbi:MAG: 3-dehydroquinate synthase, partial [Clostridiales bacterium]|nr:3-dehydroquinate synthase [Clostridiales bacterium]